MIRFLKGQILKFEPTTKGARRAREIIDANPGRAISVSRNPHHVELLCDFVFHPACVAHQPPPEAWSVLSPE